MCVQVWVVCLSADGRPCSGGWLLCVCSFSHLCLLLCAYMGVVFSVCVMASMFVLCVNVFSLGALLFRCDASCLTCVGPSQGNCSSCSSGHSLQEGVCVVNTVCADGQSTIFLVYYVSAHCF